MTRAERHLLELCGRTLTLVLWHVREERNEDDPPSAAWEALTDSLGAVNNALDLLRDEDRKVTP